MPGKGSGIGIGTSTWACDSVGAGVPDWLAKALPVESESTVNVAKVSTFLVIDLKVSSQRFALMTVLKSLTSLLSILVSLTKYWS